MRTLFRKYKNDLIFLLIILLVGVVFLMLRAADGKPGGSVIVRVDGRDYAVYDLSENGVYTIKGTKGSDILEVRDGRVHMTEAECPDGLCIKMGWIDKVNDSIICLPNRIVVEIQDKKQEIDVKVR